MSVRKIEEIDWEKPDDLISDHFKVRDALYLPTWMIFHTPSEQEKANILLAAKMMEDIRVILERPIHILCWIRPATVKCTHPGYIGRNYNAAIGGAPHSAHIEGLACDYNVSAITPNDVRFLLEEHLEKLQIRMENKVDSSWVHNDCRPLLSGGKRYFRP